MFDDVFKPDLNKKEARERFNNMFSNVVRYLRYKITFIDNNSEFFSNLETKEQLEEAFRVLDVDTEQIRNMIYLLKVNYRDRYVYAQNHNCFDCIDPFRTMNSFTFFIRRYHGKYKVGMLKQKLNNIISIFTM